MLRSRASALRERSGRFQEATTPARAGRRSRSSCRRRCLRRSRRWYLRRRRRRWSGCRRGLRRGRCRAKLMPRQNADLSRAQRLVFPDAVWFPRCRAHGAEQHRRQHDRPYPRAAPSGQGHHRARGGETLFATQIPGFGQYFCFYREKCVVAAVAPVLMKPARSHSLARSQCTLAHARSLVC